MQKTLWRPHVGLDITSSLTGTVLGVRRAVQHVLERPTFLKENRLWKHHIAVVKGQAKTDTGVQEHEEPIPKTTVQFVN